MGTIPLFSHRPHCHITAALSAEPAAKLRAGVADQKSSLMLLGRYLVLLWNVGDVILQLDPFLFQHLLCPHTFAAKWYLFSHDPPHFSNPRHSPPRSFRGGTDRRPTQIISIISRSVSPHCMAAFSLTGSPLPEKPHQILPASPHPPSQRNYNHPSFR